MSYPPPPWTIQGYGFLAAHLLDTWRVRSAIPANLHLVSVVPGKTIGGVLIAAYGAGSVMAYDELIVVSGLVAGAGQLGFWISHIYVDHPDSVAGGREIWGLPKELAQFEWTFDQQLAVQVRQDDRLLCRLTCTWRSPSLPLPTLAVPIFSYRDRRLTFTAKATLHPQLAATQLHIPASSPLAALNLGQAWVAVYSDRLSAIAGIPVNHSAPSNS